MRVSIRNVGVKGTIVHKTGFGNIVIIDGADSNNVYISNFLTVSEGVNYLRYRNVPEIIIQSLLSVCPDNIYIERHDDYLEFLSRYYPNSVLFKKLFPKHRIVSDTIIKVEVG